MRDQVDAAATEYDALKKDVNTKVLMVEDHRLRMLNSTLESYQVRFGAGAGWSGACSERSSISDPARRPPFLSADGRRGAHGEGHHRLARTSLPPPLRHAACLCVWHSAVSPHPFSHSPTVIAGSGRGEPPEAGVRRRGQFSRGLSRSASCVSPTLSLSLYINAVHRAG